jgi:nucleotide-binding universal stress UspA family protein
MAKIVVGVDESMGAAEALRWALREAELSGRELQAVMAWGLLTQHHRVVEDERFDTDYGEADARAALDAYVDAVAGPAPAVSIERTVVCDGPAWALLAAAEDADLLVVGARGLGGFKGLLVGSVSQQCLHHAPSPIAVVRGPQTLHPTEQERVVVGVDGSANSQRALMWAADAARRRGATLDVVHAWHYPVGGLPTVDLPYHAAGTFDPSVFEPAAQDVLDTVMDRTDLGGLVAPPTKVLVCGGAGRSILHAAKDADMVVVGARGLGGFRRMLLGSVSQQVATHADCTVVVVPPAR